ncbi:MAG TPA: FGGY-family carbohydrate kinase [Rubrivivax sp.]
MSHAASAELLAVDLGTQSLRVTAYSGSGRKAWTWSAPVDSHIDGDVFEQSPAQWSALLMQGLSAAQQAGVRPAAIAAAGPLAGYVALDAAGQPLGAATMYPDRRAAPQARRVTAALGASGSDRGLRVHPADPLPQWLRFAESLPEAASRTHHFVDATGWLNHFLSGECTLNPFTGLRLYDAALRHALGCEDAPFGRIVDVGAELGTLRPALTECFGFGRVRVFGAAFDSKCAYLGSGLSLPGEATDISGTVSSFGVFWPQPIDDPARRIYSVPFDGQHLVRGSTAAAGSSLEWARGLLHADPEALEHQAAAVPPGARGLSFLPYLSGERSPLWNPWASGALLGLRLDTTQADIARAVFEGLAFSVGHINDVMHERGIVLRNVRLAGGLARSALLCQIKADVLGVPVARFVDHELTSLGLGAVLAAATGQAADLAEAGRRFTAIERWFEPCDATRPAHKAACERYRAASAALEPGFTRDAKTAET